MDTIKLGYVHMPRGNAVGDPYAYMSYRVWYMPWRWEIVAMYPYNKPDVILAHSISAAAAKGLLKILGVYPHREY